eukprot:588837-Amphidinium_carterae.1
MTIRTSRYNMLFACSILHRGPAAECHHLQRFDKCLREKQATREGIAALRGDASSRSPSTSNDGIMGSGPSNANHEGANYA